MKNKKYFCEACGDCLESYSDEVCMVTGKEHIWPQNLSTGGKVMSKTLDLLLKLDQSKLIRPRKEVEIKRLSEAAGEKVVFVCEALTADEYVGIQEMVLDVEKQDVDVPEMQVQVTLAGVKEPNLKERALLDYYNVPTPKELLRKLLLPGEIIALYNTISELSGYGKKAVEEVKN